MALVRQLVPGVGRGLLGRKRPSNPPGRTTQPKTAKRCDQFHSVRTQGKLPLKSDDTIPPTPVVARLRQQDLEPCISQVSATRYLTEGGHSAY